MTRISALIEPATRRRQRDRQGGFTLMEVVLALMIAGMLATLAVPYLRPMAGSRSALTTANAIAGLLRRDRNMVLRLQRDNLVAVDVKRGSVQSARLAQAVVIPEGIKLRIVPENAPGVAFAADGSATGARLVLTAQRTSFAIDVNRLTAAISVSRLER